MLNPNDQWVNMRMAQYKNKDEMLAGRSLYIELKDKLTTNEPTMDRFCSIMILKLTGAINN